MVADAAPVADVSHANGGTTGPISATDPSSARAGLAMRWVHPERGRTSIPLVRGTYRIGRDAASDIPVSGKAVSRQHAHIERRGGATAVVDLASRNGVFVDGKRVRVAPLVTGSVLRVGDWVGVVHAIAGTEPDYVDVQFGNMVGSLILRRALEVARLAAPSPLTVLVTGETGTGKELVARAIHAASRRPGKLIAVNCAALTETLLDAELFGHERGAFTGADRARPGWVREADRGTLFLDEIGELSAAGQAKLLRALEAREVTPVGATRAVPVDLRVVCATHRSLDSLVARDVFRSDLYARLDGAHVRLPSLRERRQDIAELFLRFAECALAKPCPPMSSRFVETLCRYDWPRNVRELRQAAEKMCVLGGALPDWRRRHLAELLELPARSALEAERSTLPSAPSTGDPSRDFEGVLSQSAGNVSEAARRLGVSKQSVYRWITARGLDLETFRTPGARKG